MSAPPMPSATSGAAKLAAVDAATIPRGSIAAIKMRSLPDRLVPTVATTATNGRTTRTSSITSATDGHTTPFNDSGVTVAEIEMNNSPIVSCTSVLSCRQSVGRWTPGRLATTSPMVMAATSPASPCQASHRPAVVRTAAMMASAARAPVSRIFFSRNHNTPTPIAPPRTPTARRPAKASRPLATPCPWSVVISWYTTAAISAPIGSTVVPSWVRITVGRRPGRAALRMGPTTVGPETIKIAPSMMAACVERPSSRPAKTAAPAQVIGIPRPRRRRTTTWLSPESSLRTRSSPPSNRMTATARLTIGWKAAPNSFSGLTDVTRAHATPRAGAR